MSIGLGCTIRSPIWNVESTHATWKLVRAASAWDARGTPDGRLVPAVDVDPDAEVPAELRVPDVEGLPLVVEKRRYDPQ
ncbi:hypothetical protein ACFXGI_16765 [Streptomyces sp. NPDC059355]|uniref:hypothetical protein n=1 Tax=Streptomyces sp. NPDC059355 TaxID=3346811 RepID=UPI0036AFE317